MPSQPFMTHPKYTIEQISIILRPIFQSHHVQKAIIFGSYAKGTAQENSDIDLLVDSRLKGLAFYGLLEDIVSALEVDVDLIDASQIEPNSELEIDISKTGLVIFQNME